MPVHRRVTYKLYAAATRVAEADRVRGLHCELYNAALQERLDAWRMERVSIGYVAQCRSLTQIRRENPEYAALNAQSLQVTLKRLDRAFQAFYARCKEYPAKLAAWRAVGADPAKKPKKPGPPRFKSKARFSGFGMNPQSGWAFTPGENWCHGKLRLSGIGEFRARCEARTPGRIATADMCRKTDGWFLSVVLECEPYRERMGDAVAGLDWGVETLATLCHGPMQFSEIPNDRLLRQEQNAIKDAQRALSKALLGKRSRRAARARRLLAKRHRHLANRRKNRNHQTTARLVRNHAVIVTEYLSVGNMTVSAKGTAERPGKNVARKAGLNRAILDASPGAWLSMVRYKAEEAGARLILVDPRKHRPSQTDPVSGEVRKKPLSQRTHTLPDGTVIGRDQAAAWVLWNIGQRILGQELTSAATPETSASAA